MCLAENRDRSTRRSCWATAVTGMAVAGEAVRIRFRIATDEAANDIGWQLDNLAFQGITNLPFPSFIPDESRCRGVPKR